jgi:ribosomal protein S18 acetylase RimI-like enzyme
MIRPMESRDKAAVMALIEATNFFHAHEVIVAEELVDVYLGVPDQKDYQVIVIESAEGEVAGYLTYGPTPMAVGVYDLYWMAVDPQAQGQGYGRRLVEWLEAYVKAEHGRLIIIETSSSGKYEPTRRFYLGLKYTEVARIPDYYQDGDDRVIYTKRMV